MPSSPDGEMPAGLDPRLVRALEHPVRVDFLRLLGDRASLSPREALPRLRRRGLGLGNVTYHVRVLAQLGLVEPAGEAAAGGGLPFRPTPRGEAAAAALGLFRGDGDI